MSETEPLEVLSLLVVVWIVIYMVSRIEGVANALSKRGIEIMFFGVMWRTNRGKRFLRKLGEKKRFANIYGYLAFFYAIGLSIFGLYFLTANIFKLLFPSMGKAAALTPIIPGVTLRLSFEELVIVIVVIALTVFLHEASHALLASARGIDIRSVGLAVFIFFPAGFVELDEKAFSKASKVDKLLTYSAGAFANLITWAIALAALLNVNVLMAWGYDTSPSGVLVVGVLNNSPAARAGLASGDAITSINDTKINSLDAFLRYMSSTSPNQTLMLTVARDGGKLTIKLKLTKHPTLDTGFMGVQVYNYYAPKFSLSPLTPYYFSVFLNWLVVVSLSVAILNVLPIPLLDGDKIWGELIGQKNLFLGILRGYSLLILMINLVHGVGLL